MSTEQTAQILEYRHVDSAMAALAKASHIGSAKRAAEVLGRLAPLVAEAVGAAGQSQATAKELLVTARGLSWVQRASPEVLFENEDSAVGQELAKTIFGATFPQLVSSVASNEDINETNAAVFLEVVSAVTLSVMAGRPDEHLSLEGLSAVLAANAPDGPMPEAAGAPEPEAVAKTEPVAAAPVQATAATTAASAASTTPTPTPVADESKSNKGLLVGAALALVAAMGIGFVAFGGGSDDGGDAEPEPIALDTDAPADEATNDGSDDVEEDAAADVAVEEDAADDGIEPISTVDDEMVALSVPMLDITDPDGTASGVLHFNFNTVTGEVCYSVESTEITGPYRSHIHVGAYGEQGGIVIDLGPLESGEIGCVDNLAIDTAAILADRSNHYAELHDISEEFTIRGQLSESIEGDVVSLSVPMVNAEEGHADASGVLNFAFDTVTGEVCYSVESINIDGPYRSHIHVGGADVSGGIVVDLGSLDSGDVGCVDNLAIDTNAILADKNGHYAELHDFSEEFSIRGQLSETIAVEEDQAEEQAAEVDTEGGGASIVLDGGTVYLEGAVPDQATADEMFGSLSGIAAATPVVNNLTIDSDAPLPSGRVLIADAVFFDVASDEIKTIDDATLEAITALALSRDDWVLTVVGHTDSQGSDVDNLELSLRRATSLRDLLASQGVSDENLRIRGAGETAPIGDNGTAAGRAQNRRIEFEFTPKS